MLQIIKKVIQEELQFLLNNAKKRSEQRKQQQAQKKAEEIQRQKELAKQHLFETKRYFMASFLDFYVLSQGDVYEIFPHRRYKMHNIINSFVLDVRTKVRGMDKEKKKKLKTDLLTDFNACEENFWQNFAEISNLQAKEFERLNWHIDTIVARAYEDEAKGVLTTSMRIQYQKDYDELCDKRHDIQEELALRWEIWNTHFFITKLEFHDGFLEFEIR
ncbi:MAG: hypothetical protein K2J67_08940 [Lachnospiraceae bacterium]|nr:hypothetical protein [Lachnospiraceae bacterium]